MRTTEIAIAGAAGGAWVLYYVGIKMASPTRNAEWCSRIVSCTHAVVVSSLAANALRTGPHPLVEAGADNEFPQDLAIAVSIGYFLYDIVWMYFYTPDDTVMIVHHITATAALNLVLLSGRSGIETCVSLIAMEMTNPLLQARWFIRDAGYKNSTLFKVVDLSFITLFVFCRVGVGSYFLYKVCTHPRPALSLKIVSCAFSCVSWAFLYYIMKYVRRKYLSATPSEDPEAQ